MRYVMCYAAAVKTEERDAYSRAAAQAAQVFRDHGALRVVECWGDAVPEGKLTSFPRAVRAENDETVVLGWQEWPDREAQRRGVQAAMQDPRMADAGAMPFDGKRLIHAGFETLLDMQDATHG
ncbi:MAG: DUF1428 domain-containing protein [Tranquillimonas sp.]